MDNLKKALGKAKNLCSKKEMCVFDIMKKLNNWELNDFEKEDIVLKLVEANYIDEQRYAKAFVNDKFKFNKWGKIKIKYHLKQKRISDNYINKAILKIEDAEYYNTLRKLIANKMLSFKEGKTNKNKEKIIRFAQTRGFELDIIFEVLNKAY